MLNKNQFDARLAALSPEKRELLRAKLNERTRNPGTARLSYAQQRIWFGQQIDPGSAAYNVPFDIPYRGALNQSAVRDALNELVRRHEGLRTIFPVSDDSPVQRILEPKPVALPIVDFSTLPAISRDTAARQSAEQEASRPFDLAHGPLFRATLLRLERNHTVLLCTLHHIICDGWSIAVLLDEFSALYLAFSEGREPNLPAISVQYRDYAEWQRQQGTEVFDTDLSYWRNQLDGVTPVDLPPDLARIERTTTPPAAGIAFTWPKDLAARLAEFGNAEGMTPFIVLVAIFQWLLSRYTEQDDITIGTDIAGRNRLETERIVGYFVNQVILRTKLQPHWTFRELLSRVRETVLDAYAHQELPFDRLVDSLAPRREVGRTPFFQAKLVVQNMPGAKPGLEGFGESHWQLGNYSAKLDITLAFRLTAESIGGVIEYASDLYSRVRIEALLRHFKGLVSDAVAYPDKRLLDLALVDPVEEQELLDWSSGPRLETPRLCLHELFSNQAARTPEAPALLTDGEQISYATLEVQANQLAHYLRRLGVTSEVRVGIYLPRSLSLFQVMLAILKAGGAYVPLDPDYPRQRLADLIEDAQLAVIVTDSNQEGSLPSSWAHIVSLDTEKQSIESEPDSMPESGVVPGNTAYVIFTSGSTGRAKGVAVPHSGVVNMALSQIDGLRITCGRTVAQFAPIAFDASVWEWTMTLLSGATLAIGSREALAPGEPLADFMDRHAVNVLTLPSSILARVPAGRLATVETLIVAGEACPQELVKRWATGRRMHNAYGPTETSVCATISRPLESHWRISIGTPLRNLDTYLLDERLRPVPVGVPGDLYVAGIGLAHGYLNRPSLTAAAFVPNPFGGPGARCYKTGDRGRWLPDKTIEFIGRSDEQIKVHGCRVEPGEIASALMRHIGVREAAVNLNNLNGSSALVAYVVGEAELAELRDYLSKQLPSYMVPQRLVQLESLPLTSNGKIDHKALPEPEPVAEESHDYVGPRTPAEELLCGIWAEVLVREQVGVHDNFFELGGDSILSIQIASRAKQVGLSLTARDLFEHQTIAQLALAIAPHLMPTRSHNGAGEFALTPIQEWFYAQEWERPWHYNQGALLADGGRLAGRRLQQAVEQVLGRHQVFRLRFGRNAEGKLCQRYASGSENESAPGCGRADLRALPAAVQGRVVEAVAEQVQTSLEPEQGRLVAALRLEASSGGGRLLVVAHHLVIDGVSWRILLDEVERTYGGLQEASVSGAARVTGAVGSSGSGSDVARGGSSYGEWAERLVAEAAAAATAAELEYWVAQQEGEELPREQELGADTVGATEAVTVEFSAAETATLLRAVPRQLRAQLEEVLLLGVVEAVCEWSGRETLVVRCEGHGREPLTGVAVEQTVGWFTTLYPVRFERGRGSVRERLRGVQQRLQAVPRRGLGYGLLKYVQGAAALAGERQAAVSFNYLGQWDANLAGIFQGAAESVGRSQWAGERRGAEWEVHGSVHGGRLRLAWSYSRNAHRRETLERVAERFRAVLVEVIAACHHERQPLAPAEVSDISLSDLEWKDLLAEVGARE